MNVIKVETTIYGWACLIVIYDEIVPRYFLKYPGTTYPEPDYVFFDHNTMIHYAKTHPVCSQNGSQTGRK